jgi:hypothetical protein
MSNIVLSYVEPNATTIQHNGTSQQQKSQLPNPFELEDYHILNKVYLTHVNDDEKYDKDILFKLVSNIISASAQISGTNSVLNVINLITPSLSFQLHILISFATYFILFI